MFKYLRQKTLFFFLLLSVVATLFLLSLGKQKGPIRVLALTENEFAGPDGWPAQLEKVLNGKAGEQKYFVIPITGSNSNVILSNFEERVDELKPKIIVAMMGINDAHAPMAQNQPAISSSIPEEDKDSKQINPLVAEGTQLINQGRYEEAEKLLKKALDVNPKDEEAHFQLGMLYCFQEKLELSESAFFEALEINPNNSETYTELGRLYRNFRLFDKAEPMFEKAIQVDPKNERAHYEFGKFYIDQEKLTEAEKLLVRAIEINPESVEGLIGLGRLNRKKGQLERAEPQLLLALKVNKKQGNTNTQNEAIALDELSRVYRRENRLEEADKIEARLLELTSTRKNYREVNELVKRNKIKLIAVQYPLRDPNILKSILDNAGGISYLGNQKNFSEALKKEGYEIYFTDRGFGDFGHLTERGARLLAEGIARSILND